MTKLFANNYNYRKQSNLFPFTNEMYEINKSGEEEDRLRAIRKQNLYLIRNIHMFLELSIEIYKNHQFLERE